MKFLRTRFAGQSILSWFFQIILIVIAWRVSTHQMPNNITTITITAVILLLIYWSFSLDRKKDKSK
ncbi:hypothetical protein YK48G_16610 [Lentilactobacillus fungorum]|uniref:Uncharacterized protein n=1 Tax=Lentilactobacillus fungorum TaxID=2201250 RepID=A0ABQ3W1B3_9LACO|nr:hypothetical protein [Lentilactobacillus fungorum]GHP14236.1 hypothetical protein YK48G_16610 [Lentilactobacillus fungorum]